MQVLALLSSSKCSIEHFFLLMVLGDCINAVSTVYLDTALMLSPKTIKVYTV